MSRYRPPAPAKSPYITPEGHRALLDELSYLWRVKRPQVTQAVSDAAKQGDRSENAEYIYGKKQLREIDSRVRYLQKRLDQIQVVEHRPADENKVYFSAWIEVEDEQGEVLSFRIVGADEFDKNDNYISIDSPMARAILGRQLDDEFSVLTPKGSRQYVITRIWY